jgi:hypothetical protein
MESIADDNTAIEPLNIQNIIFIDTRISAVNDDTIVAIFSKGICIYKKIFIELY